MTDERKGSWRRAAAAGVAAAAFTTVDLRLDEPDRPWRAVVLGGLLVAIVAIGYLGGRWPAVALGLVAVATPMIVERVLSGDVAGPEPDPGCDPSCGLGLVDSLLLVLPFVAALAAAGVGARALVRRWLLRSSRRLQSNDLAQS